MNLQDDLSTDFVIEVSKKTARVYALEYMGPKRWDCDRYGAQETLTEKHDHRKTQIPWTNVCSRASLTTCERGNMPDNEVLRWHDNRSLMGSREA